MAEEDYQIDETKSAKFNAGVLQTQRVNKILDLLNFCKNNPLAFNIDYNDWNFNLIQSSIGNLYDEIDGFLDDKERKLCIDMLHKITEIVEKYPLLENQRKAASGSNTKVPNADNWKILKRAFEHAERIIKRYGIKYQVIAATIDTGWYDGL